MVHMINGDAATRFRVRHREREREREERRGENEYICLFFNKENRNFFSSGSCDTSECGIKSKEVHL